MRVPESSRHVEAEVMWILNKIVSQFDILDTLLFEGGLLEDRLQDRVKFLSHVLHEYWCAELDGVFQRTDIIGIRDLDNA